MVATDDASAARARGGALALVEAGFDVTLLTVGEDAGGAENGPGVVNVIRLAVPFNLRDERRARMARRRKWAPVVGYRDGLAERAARARLQAARLAVASSGRPAVTSAVLRFREQTLNARVLTQRAIRKALRIAWRSLDVTVDRLPAGASWRRSFPETDDYEAVFGPALDRLGADAFYVHDVALVGVVARASARARLAGRKVPWVCDADVDLAKDDPRLASSPRRRAATLSLEKDFLRYAARVVAASEPLADSLQRRCRLASRPTVIATHDVARIADLYAELLAAEPVS
jgi:hypothetical protein